MGPVVALFLSARFTAVSTIPIHCIMAAPRWGTTTNWVLHRALARSFLDDRSKRTASKGWASWPSCLQYLQYAHHGEQVMFPGPPAAHLPICRIYELLVHFLRGSTPSGSSVESSTRYGESQACRVTGHDPGPPSPQGAGGALQSGANRSHAIPARWPTRARRLHQSSYRHLGVWLLLKLVQSPAN